MQATIKKALWSSFFLVAVCGYVQAEAMFYTVPGTKYQLETTLPNGKTEKVSLEAGSSGIGHERMYLLDSLKKAKITISDSAGQPVWSGELANQMAHLLVPTADGKLRVLTAGYPAGSDGGPIFLANVTGQAIKIDLAGNSGVPGPQCLEPGDSFDSKAAIKLNPSEGCYRVTVAGPDGSKSATENNITRLGRYYVVFRRVDGKFDIEMLGCLKP